MSLTLDLPPQLAEEFDRKALDPAEHATLILHLAASLLKDEAETRFQGAVKEFLATHSIDAAKVSSVLGELIGLCEGVDVARSDESAGSEAIGNVLRGWREAVAQRLGPESPIAEPPSPGDSTRQLGQRPRVSAFGKYADVPISSEAFAREKQEEIEREERRWR